MAGRIGSFDAEQGELGTKPLTLEELKAEVSVYDTECTAFAGKIDAIRIKMEDGSLLTYEAQEKVSNLDNERDELRQGKIGLIAAKQASFSATRNPDVQDFRTIASSIDGSYQQIIDAAVRFDKSHLDLVKSQPEWDLDEEK